MGHMWERALEDLMQQDGVVIRWHDCGVIIRQHEAAVEDLMQHEGLEALGVVGGRHR